MSRKTRLISCGNDFDFEEGLDHKVGWLGDTSFEEVKKELTYPKLCKFKKEYFPDFVLRYDVMVIARQFTNHVVLENSYNFALSSSPD